MAVKIVKSDIQFSEMALDEIELLKSVSTKPRNAKLSWIFPAIARLLLHSSFGCQVRNADKRDPHREKTVQLLDNFDVNGVDGTVHICMVFEMVGDNLLKLILRSEYRGLPRANVKSIMKQVQTPEFIPSKFRTRST